MKIPGLADLREDVKRIADALEKLAAQAEKLANKPAEETNLDSYRKDLKT